MPREMARKPRYIHPSISTSADLARCSALAQLLFTFGFPNADDQGRLTGDPVKLKLIVVPGTKEITAETIPDLLQELVSNDLVILYHASSEPVIQFKGWWGFQGQQRWAYPSKYPSPNGWVDHLRTRRREPNEPEPVPTLSVQEQTPSVTVPTLAAQRQPMSVKDAPVPVPVPVPVRDIPTVYPAAPNAAPNTEKPPKTTRQKPKQAEAGTFLDMVEQHIGTKLVQRPKHMGQIRPLLVKFPEATPERLLDCFKWLKQHDPYCQARDSPMVISMLPSKYPEWAAGKLSVGGQPRGSPKLPTADELKSRTKKFMKGEK